MMSLNKHESNELPDLLTTSPAMCLTKKVKGLEIIIGPMLGHKVPFIYSYEFQHEMLMLEIFFFIHP
jgi:hypothetical protein